MMKISVESESSDIFGHAFKTINQPSRISQASIRSLSACLWRFFFLLWNSLCEQQVLAYDLMAFKILWKILLMPVSLKPSELHNNWGWNTVWPSKSDFENLQLDPLTEYLEVL